MSKEALVVFPNNNPPDRSFKRSEWPAHATVVPWFKNPKHKREKVYSDLGETLEGVEPFVANVSSRGRTRYNPARGVAKLDHEPWQKIHEELMPKIAGHIGKLAMLPTTIYARGLSMRGLGKYRPHVTDQKDSRLHEGYPFEVNEVHVVRKSIIPGRRKVVRSFPLGQNAAPQPDFGAGFTIPQNGGGVETGKGFALDQTMPQTQIVASPAKTPLASVENAQGAQPSSQNHTRKASN